MLEFGIGVIRPALFTFLDFFLYILRHPLDNENPSNLMFESGLYDRSIEILQHSTFVIYGIYDIR